MRNSHHGSRQFSCHYHCHDDEQQQHQGRLSPELGGAIFMCNSETRKECFKRRIFGLPACRAHFVRQVRDGMFLFLFDTDNRRMYGVFEATSNGDMNIVPGAFSSSGRAYPAQVQFAIRSACQPLTEPEFRPAILENYFTDIKFKFDLNFDQVQRLLVLFEEKKVGRVSQPITDEYDRSSLTSSPFERRYVYQQHDNVSYTNTLLQTTQRQIRNANPIDEAATYFVNSDINLASPRNDNWGEQVDAYVVRNQTRICYTDNANSSRYRNDPAEQGVPSLSSHHLAQHQEPFGYCTGMSNCVVCTQKMVPAAEVDDADPPYPEDTTMTVGTYSKFGGSQGRDQVYNNQSQDVDQRKSVFSRLARKRHREAWEEEPCQTIVHLTKNQPGDRSARRPRRIYNEHVVQDEEPFHIEGLASADCTFVMDGFESDTTVPLPNSALRAYEVCNANFKRGNRNSKLSIELKGECKKRLRSSLDGADELKEDKKKRRLVSRRPMVTYTEVDPDSDGADGRVVDPSVAVSNLIAESSETQIPFVNFNRRNVGSKLSIEPKRDGKKRRLIRPSLELVNENNHLQVGPMQVANCFNEPLKNSSLVGTKSALDGESMALTDIMHVEAQEDSKSLEISQGSVCKSEENKSELKLVDTQHEGFQNHCEGERVVLSSMGKKTERTNLDREMNLNAESSVVQVGHMQVATNLNESLKNSSLVGTKSALDGESMELSNIMHVVDIRQEGFQGRSMVIETERAKLDLEMSSNAESSALAFGQCRTDMNDILVFIESESNKLKQHFEESKKPLFRSDTCYEKIPEKSKVETEHVVETIPDDRQMILVSSSEKTDTLKLNKATAIFSDRHPDLLVMGEKTDEKTLVSNAKPIALELITEIEENSGFEGEAENSNVSTCLHNEKSNLVEECIAPEPKARDLKTSPVSHKEKNSNPVKEDRTLQPGCYH